MNTPTKDNFTRQPLLARSQEISSDVRLEEDIHRLQQINQCLIAILLLVATTAGVITFRRTPMNPECLLVPLAMAALVAFVKKEYARDKGDASRSTVLLPLLAQPGNTQHRHQCPSKPHSTERSTDHDFRASTKNAKPERKKRTGRKSRRRNKRATVSEEKPVFMYGTTSPATEETESESGYSSNDGIALPRGFMNCTPLPNYPTLFPYHADSQDRVLAW